MKKRITNIITAIAMSLSFTMALSKNCDAQTVGVAGPTPAEAVAAALSENAATERIPTDTLQKLEMLEPTIDELLAQGFWFSRNLEFDAERIEEIFETEMRALIDRIRTYREEAELRDPNPESLRADAEKLLDDVVTEDSVETEDAVVTIASRAVKTPLVEAETYPQAEARAVETEFPYDDVWRNDAVKLGWETISSNLAEADDDDLENSVEALHTYADALDSIVDLVRAEIASIVRTVRSASINDDWAN